MSFHARHYPIDRAPGLDASLDVKSETKKTAVLDDYLTHRAMHPADARLLFASHPHAHCLNGNDLYIGPGLSDRIHPLLTHYLLSSACIQSRLCQSSS